MIDDVPPRLLPLSACAATVRGGGMAIRASRWNFVRAKFPRSFHADCWKWISGKIEPPLRPRCTPISTAIQSLGRNSVTRNGKRVTCHGSRNRSPCETNIGAWTTGRARLEAVKTRVGNRARKQDRPLTAHGHCPRNGAAPHPCCPTKQDVP